MTEVLWEDQQRINEFSKLNGRLVSRQDKLKNYKKEKEYLEDVTNELELVDEDEIVNYKVGDTFVGLKQEEVMERLEKESAELDDLIEKEEAGLDDINGQMGELKKALYAKFGNSINLEK